MRTLKQALNQGPVLQKSHRVIKRTLKSWLKQYINNINIDLT